MNLFVVSSYVITCLALVLLGLLSLWQLKKAQTDIRKIYLKSQVSTDIQRDLP